MKRLSPGTSAMFEGEQFDVLELIGEGGFAKVFRCNSEDGSTYAVKVIHAFFNFQVCFTGLQFITLLPFYIQFLEIFTYNSINVYAAVGFP